MTKKMFAIYFGLVVLALSLFASTAFASSATSISVRDVDAPARKPFQTAFVIMNAPVGTTTQSLATVPANQRLVVERVAGRCINVTGNVYLSSGVGQPPDFADEILPEDFQSGHYTATSTRFYVDQNLQLSIVVANLGNDPGSCTFTVSGYYVNLP